MFPFLPTLTADSMSPKYLGKKRKYRLHRSGKDLLFTGKMLAFYHREEEGPVLPGGTMDKAAVFATASGKYLIWYVVRQGEGDYGHKQDEFAQIFDKLDELTAFVAVMTYVNKDSFSEPLIESVLRWRMV